MKLLELTIKNFGLFKSASITPQAINLITGINKDTPNNSGNGSAKSTLGKLAIIFLLYGEGCGKKLERLIRFGTKKTIVAGKIEHRGNIYEITRTVPNSLDIKVNGELKDFNTVSIGQSYLDSIFDDYSFYKKYCLIDASGINILNSLGDVRSIVSFKKELCAFIDTEFAPIRESLLKKKNNMELFSVDKRLYKFSLSQKRLTILNNGLKQIKENLIDSRKDIDSQNEIVNQIKSDIRDNEHFIEESNNQVSQCETNVLKNETIITDYHLKITNLENQPNKTIPEISNYDDLQKQINLDIENIQQKIETIETDIKKYEESINKTKTEQTKYNSSKQQLELEISKLKKEIESIKNLVEGNCDKCGNPITEENKDKFIGEKEVIIIEKEVIITQINTKIEDLEKEVIIFKKERLLLDNLKNENKTSIANKQKELSKINNNKFSQEQLLNEIKNQQSKKESETQKYKELIDTYIKQNEDNAKKIVQLNKNLVAYSNKLKELEISLKSESDNEKYYNDLYAEIQRKERKTEEYLLKLREAFKFEAYKYNDSDIQLYTDSIKTLDSFSGFFITEWINNLSFIINDLLKNVNLSIELTDSKEFIKIKDGENELNYSDLSDGQKIFFSTVFRLSILLQKGDSDKIITCDDGLGAVDVINFRNLITIFQTLPMQFFCVYQNPPQIGEINYINIERKNGESRVI